MAFRDGWARFFIDSSRARLIASLICFSILSACSSSQKAPEAPDSTQENPASKSDEKPESESKPKVKRKRSDDYPGLW